MLSKLRMKLEKNELIDINSGSLFQGIIMENISPEYAEELHEGGLNPYSQSLIINKDELIWEISTLTEEAAENILKPLLSEDFNFVNIKYKGLELKIEEKELQTISREEFVDETYFGEANPYITVRFSSPTAFKTDGKYQFYPTVQHFFNSLIKKYDKFSDESEIMSEELMNDILKHVSIVKYNLRSTFFYLENARIPAFTGILTFKASGPKLFINLMNILAAFGEYSGVGIKTSMGMGRINILRERKGK